MFSLLESCQLYIIAKYEASNCCKTEAVIQRCSAKKFFSKILQNSQEKHEARVSFLIKFQLKKRLWHGCFPVNIAKFLRKSFLYRTPSVAASSKISAWHEQIFDSSYFWLHVISWTTSTLWQNSCKTRNI